jgi:hypothetical protein
MYAEPEPLVLVFWKSSIREWVPEYAWAVVTLTPRPAS